MVSNKQIEEVFFFTLTVRLLYNVVSLKNRIYGGVTHLALAKATYHSALSDFII